MVKDSARSARESSLASGWTVEGQPEVAPEIEEHGIAEADAETGPGEYQQLSAGALVLLGLIGGIYLLYTMVWFSWTNYYSTINSAVAQSSGAIGGVLQQIALWVAPFAPALWFLTVLSLCRGSQVWRKVVWLLVGLVVLVPLPMFGGGA